MGQTRSMRDGGDIIVEYLIREKVPYVFGLCGHGNVGLLDALYDRTDAIRTISTRHEQTAGHMADAFFRVAHRPVATLTSCGPGSANIPITLANAFMDSSAFLAITANVPTSQFNRAAFQETYRHFQADFPSVVRPYVKQSWQPTRVDMLPLALRQAFQTMLSGRPGPVNLDVPFNLFKEEADVEVPDPVAWRAGISSRSGGDPELVGRVVDRLVRARRPLIYAGHGVALSEAAPDLTALARQLRIPVIFAPNALGALPADDPLALGFIGRNGVFHANEAARTADVLLAMGVRFDDRSSSSWIPGYSFNIPPTELIHVDIDPGEIGRNYPVDVGIVGDARTVLRQMLAHAGSARPDPGAREAWLGDIAKWRAQWEEFVRPGAESDAEPIHPRRVVAALRRVMPDDGLVLPDVGVHHNWMVQFWPARRPGTLLSTWGCAASSAPSSPPPRSRAWPCAATAAS
jgi:acetolactate synthase-1/2/3 large subunit